MLTCGVLADQVTYSGGCGIFSMAKQMLPMYKTSLQICSTLSVACVL